MSAATLISDSKPKKQAVTQKPAGAADFAFSADANVEFKMRWIDSIEELESLRPAWNELANNATHRNPNFESNFLIPAMRHLASKDVRVLVAEAEFGEHTILAALIPFATTKVFGLPLSAMEIWHHEQSFDSTPLIRSECASLVWPQIISCLQQEKISFLKMEQTSAEGPFEALVEQMESQPNVTLFRKNVFSRAAIRPSGTADEYKQKQFSKNLRKSTRRQLKKLEALGNISFEKSDGHSDFESLANEFLNVEASGWKGTEGTALRSHESTRNFYHELIQRSAAEGKARFLVMRLEGQPLSILSDLQSGDGVYAYKTAFDEDFAEFSPGIQAEIKNIDHLFADNIEFADSCTTANNSAINRIWGHREKFQNLVVALRPGMPGLLTRWMPTLQNLVQKFRRS